ncbi:hypothetical protein FPV67DRAFT_1497418 [Lyophyllum atratum]|nr:hypothetical protein FPV67DRAFT_1497418 [Lyophyllum atratum]
MSHTLPTHAMTPAQPTHLSPHRSSYHPHFAMPQTSPPDRRQASVSLRQAIDDTQSSLYEPPERSPPSARSVNNPSHPTHAHPPRLPSTTNSNTFVHTTNTHAVPVPALSRDFLAPSPRSEPSAYFPLAKPTSSPFLAVYQEHPESPTKLYSYSSSSVGQGDGPSDEHRYGVSGVLLYEERRGMPEMWMDDNTSAMDHVPGFGNGTIDPSLLGGGQAAEEEHTLVQPLVEYDSSSPTPPPSPPAATWHVNPLVAYESLSPSRSSSPPPPPHSFSRSPESHRSRSRSSSQPLSPTRSVRESTAQTHPATSNDPVSNASSLPSWTQPLPRRSRQPRRAPDGMVATGDLDVSSSDESWSDQENRRQKKKSRRLSMSLDPIPLSGPAARADGASTSTSDHQMGQPARTMAQRPGAKGIRYPQVAEFEYCHQCRSQTNILKFVCPCEKRYCYRCLHTRYTGEQAYNLTLLSFTCPLCKNMCNCTKCCKKRGEVYVGSRSRPEPVKRPALQKPSREASNPARTVLPRHAGKTDVSDAVPVTTYWATMYGLNGQKIGNAFVGDDGNEDVVVMRGLGEPAPETRKRERIFVGDVQEAWGFSDRCLLKDVDPVSWRDRNNGPNERVYVGKKALLYMPKVLRRRRAGLGVQTVGHSQWTSYAGEEFSSPLSSIDGESDDGGAGEGGS